MARIEKKMRRTEIAKIIVQGGILAFMNTFSICKLGFAQIKSDLFNQREILPFVEVLLLSENKINIYENSLFANFSSNRYQTTLQLNQDNYSIQNRSNTKLIFYLSNDRQNWKRFEIYSGEAKEFKAERYPYIKVTTPNSGFVTYKLDLLNRYELRWNSLMSKWDVFRVSQ